MDLSSLPALVCYIFAIVCIFHVFPLLVCVISLNINDLLGLADDRVKTELALDPGKNAVTSTCVSNRMSDSERGTLCANVCINIETNRFLLSLVH